ncbi:unnamed protein product [Timema podura]|uniref:Uncharacterized protein n=1 Tax=Timema podura TaxID=61482 RepID=A0ABN7NSD8_TIMPD|nr:unnamed protein product [Timema podura]
MQRHCILSVEIQLKMYKINLSKM